MGSYMLQLSHIARKTSNDTGRNGTGARSNTHCITVGCSAPDRNLHRRGGGLPMMRTEVPLPFRSAAQTNWPCRPSHSTPTRAPPT